MMKTRTLEVRSLAGRAGAGRDTALVWPASHRLSARSLLRCNRSSIVICAMCATVEPSSLRLSE